MSLKIDRFIVSADYNPKFLDFWPIVSKAVRYYLRLNPTLALVGAPDLSPSSKIELSRYGEVCYLDPVPGIPLANQAKLARFFLAAKMGPLLTMIDDIDTIHLQSAYLQSRIMHRTRGRLLCVGREVYANSIDEGKFPAGNMCGEGYVFKEIFNPFDSSFSEFIQRFVGLRIFDKKEDPSNNPEQFSDESLIRAIAFMNHCESMMEHVSRNLNPLERWLDRSWWNYDKTKLYSGFYYSINFPRPLFSNLDKVEPILSFLFSNAELQEEMNPLSRRVGINVS